MTGQTEQWHSGLCDCFTDGEICCLSFFCPCVQYGLNVSVLGESCTVCCVMYGVLMHFYCCCIVHAPMRSKLRARYNLQGDDGRDVLASLTGCMSIAQEAREIKARGPPPPLRMAMPAVAMYSTRPSASPPPPPGYAESTMQQSTQLHVTTDSESDTDHDTLTDGASIATTKSDSYYI